MSRPIRQKPDNTSEISKSIALPDEEIELSDGRKFGIKEWHPHVIADDLVTITVKIVPKAPYENDEQEEQLLNRDDVWFKCPCSDFVRTSEIHKRRNWTTSEGEVYHYHPNPTRYFKCAIVDYPYEEISRRLPFYKCPVCEERIQEGQEGQDWFILNNNNRAHNHFDENGEFPYLAVATVEVDALEE